jgi:DNA-binding NarL/FixJ family response regulator
MIRRKKWELSSHFPNPPLYSGFSEHSAAERRKGKADMDAETDPKPARPRLNPYTKALRRERIFARLSLGWSYDKIAREEGVSDRRVRQIVADALRRQELDDPTDHAIIQLMRLDAAHELAARAVDFRRPRSDRLPAQGA